MIGQAQIAQVLSIKTNEQSTLPLGRLLRLSVVHVQPSGVASIPPRNELPKATGRAERVTQ